MEPSVLSSQNNWREMLESVEGSSPTTKRRLRLWAVAWSREILACCDSQQFDHVRAWFGQEQIAHYQREIDAAELFADDRITRKSLHAAKAPSGGPWNVFHYPSGMTRLIQSTWTIELLNRFIGEFGVPSDSSLATLLHDIFGNPFRPVAFDPSWRTSTVVVLAQQMYDSRDFSPMPILADALQDAGCEDETILAHCRGDGPHVRGCWVVDLVLGKQ